MSEYSIILSQNVSNNTKIPVFELCVNGKSLFEDFIHSIEDNIFEETDLVGAIRNLELAADMYRLPKTKFREIKQQKVSNKLFEAKYGMIRIYHFQEKKTGRIIIIAGKKKNQQKDINTAINTFKKFQDGNN